MNFLDFSSYLQMSTLLFGIWLLPDSLLKASGCNATDLLTFKATDTCFDKSNKSEMFNLIFGYQETTVT